MQERVSIDETQIIFNTLGLLASTAQWWLGIEVPGWWPESVRYEHTLSRNVKHWWHLVQDSHHHSNICWRIWGLWGSRWCYKRSWWLDPDAGVWGSETICSNWYKEAVVPEGDNSSIIAFVKRFGKILVTCFGHNKLRHFCQILFFKSYVCNNHKKQCFHLYFFNKH